MNSGKISNKSTSLRIVIIVETFAKNMGYINNTLPKYLTREGHEVHVITTELSPYFQISDPDLLFGKAFSDSNKNKPGDIQKIDGYTLHILKNQSRFGYPFHVGLESLLEKIQPQIVCIFQAAGWLPIRVAWLRFKLKYKLVIGSHMGKTVFPLANSKKINLNRRLKSFFLRKLPGWFINSMAHHCVVPTIDCAEVANSFFGISKSKTIVMNLPVDGDYFYTSSTEIAQSNRSKLRKTLGVSNDEVLCIYTGKFTQEKNVVVLADAIAKLRKNGVRIRCIFVGNGEQTSLLDGVDGVQVLPFKPISELGEYYRAADIGVWMNESISFLDACCCGLPLAISDTVKDISHIQEFTRIYKSNDVDSLADCIKQLTNDSLRKKLSQQASELGFNRFDGRHYANRRLYFFNQALKGDGVKV